MLFFDQNFAKDYKSQSQIIRILSEKWAADHLYCPSCGNDEIAPFKNNQPVGDFYCQECLEQYELKSKNGKSLGNIISDGAYRTMIERILSESNPSFFFLHYNRQDLSVQNLMIVPKHFFNPEIIIPRNQGIPNRPDYIMCSINIGLVPERGKISIIKNGEFLPKEHVLNQWRSYFFLREQKIEQKGWIFEILKCIERIPSEQFTLQQLYAFEPYLRRKFPNNSWIKDKIRQQLQFLRDKGVIEFVGRGVYKKVL